MGALKAILKREFGLSSMRTRAGRKDRLILAQNHLEMWADYGNPAELETAIDILRGQ